MGEVILTADRLTQAEAKRVSKDLIGEVAPEFTLTDLSLIHISEPTRLV